MALAADNGGTLNKALEDVLSWLPSSEVHLHSAQMLKEALEQALSALQDVHLLACPKLATPGDDGSTGASAGGTVTVELPPGAEKVEGSHLHQVFTLVQNATALSARVHQDLVSAQEKLRVFRAQEAVERSLRVHAIVAQQIQ